jgi:thiol:disulfide interchange protein DsbD
MNLVNIAGCISLLLITSCARPSFAQENTEEFVLDIERATLSPHHGPASMQRTLKLDLSIKSGFKAYADKFSINFLEPYPTKHTEMKLNPVHEFYDKFSKSSKKGIKDSATLTTTIEIQQPLKEGAQKLVFELKFQACSETVCFFPQTIKRELDFVISSGEGIKANKNRSLSLLEENFANAQKRGLLYLFVFVFLAGVLTSLTPCLLPMLPLTIAVIGKGHSHDAKLKKFINAITYVLGIATTYSVLGVVAASSGALFGNILSNIWVQVGFGTAFVLMGLAQFGMFEFQTPLWLQNRFHKMGRGVGGIYVSGLLSGLIASPCVGPVLVGILTFVAQSQDRVLGFWLMFAYALGLGQLLIILGVSSSLLYRFPRLPWLMKASKTILGFALIASGLFYLSLLWPKANGIQKGPVTEVTSPARQLRWKNYSDDALAAAKALGKPVLIDFFADWCLACHELEENTFSHPEIAENLDEFVLLRFDATEEIPALEILRAKYKIVGLPTIIFYDRSGNWLSEFTLNEFESPELFKKRLEKIKSK